MKFYKGFVQKYVKVKDNKKILYIQHYNDILLVVNTVDQLFVNVYLKKGFIFFLPEI